MPYKYFSDSELSCKGENCCGGLNNMDHHFMKLVVELREAVGFPFKVTSAYRCPLHNSRVSSTGEAGPHTTGRSIDIQVSGQKAFKLIAAATRHGMTGIGVSQKGPHGSRFIHLDNLDGDNRPWVWGY